jgi:hypothetical protein
MESMSEDWNKCLPAFAEGLFACVASSAQAEIYNSALAFISCLYWAYKFGQRWEFSTFSQLYETCA